ncbi:beta-propeller domain-containing protein [Micromonospora endolithica]|uniref:Benzoate transporter n=1 Tax=Micromonospora endolithica TaxID=230091 RepID=A0A3A9ZG19_9ACTN|nr:beta-propeller domain-containing protein [Micromonospora endolithica]RKN46277.1 hypothetical protein D7223_15255 [Micromonospora endolithica]TWJ24995.1 beta propeller domain-containing protein [Micromonospora endolithica]
MKRGTPTTTAGTLLALTLLAGSAALPGGPRDDGTAPPPGPGLPTGTTRLVSFDSCAEALTDLRSAAAASVGPWGFVDDETADPIRRGVVPLREAGAAEAAGSHGPGEAPEHSTTNVREAGVDEPDLVKTDGRRIVTVTGGVLRVVDPATRRAVGRLDLAPGRSEVRWQGHDLLLHGDRALVLTDRFAPPGVTTGRRVDPAFTGAELTLVDLTGDPRVLGTYRIQGRTLDARQTGGTARVVVRSATRIAFPQDLGLASDDRGDKATAANRVVVAAAGLDAWLPAYEWTAGPQRYTGRVGCDRLSRPERFTGSSMLTVLSFDLNGDRLGDGDPVSVAADAHTVYATGESLYLAGQRELGARPESRRLPWTVDEVATDIYRFDTSAPGRPRYAAAGSVPGWLVDQYAVSEWQGHLRVATTTGGDERDSESGVHVLRRESDALVPVGRVTGLGRGERIYSVRYLGDTAYVVTFRRIDPLYTVDLSDPAAPRVTGELKITGYSAYLHPMADGRLLGVGQEADDTGRTQGLQVSLFDVRDPDRPVRLDRWHAPRNMSQAEYDPHAFLHDPATGLVAVPVPDAVRLLRVTGDSVAADGTVPHRGAIRSLLVRGVLWTVSETGLMATDPATARSLAWLPST